LPVVAITSFGENLREQARAAGATESIDKPTELAKMREVIDAAVSRASSQANSGTQQIDAVFSPTSDS
jgi:FixJ family two-component response regulator